VVVAQLAAAPTAQAKLLGSTSAEETLTAPNPVAAFDLASLVIQRAVIATVMIRLDPGQRGRKFDPATVRVEPVSGTE
jgi:hypothetical protein